jgi:hypothetical protein
MVIAKVNFQFKMAYKTTIWWLKSVNKLIQIQKFKVSCDFIQVLQPFCNDITEHDIITRSVTTRYGVIAGNES